MKKGELTLRVRDEVLHFNLNHSLKHPEFYNIDCKVVETKVPINSELIYDCNFQNLINENEMNFHTLMFLMLNLRNPILNQKRQYSILRKIV